MNNEIELADDYEPPDVALMNALAEIGDDNSEATVSVYRATPEKGLKGGAFLYSCTATEFSLETLRDAYGGGSYRVHIKKHGKIVTGGNRLVIIEEPKHSGIPFTPPTIAASQNQNNESTRLIEIMQAGFNQLGQILSQNKVPAIDPAQMRRDMMSDMLAMKELFSQQQPAQSSGVGQIEMLLKGIELAKEITPRDGETGTMDVILEAMRTFGKPIAEAAMARLPVENTGEPTKLSQAPQLPQAQSAQPTTVTEDDMTLMLRYYAGQLAAQAANDRDPYVYANLLVDNVPEAQVREILGRPDLKSYLISLNADLKNYPEWIDEFIKLVNELLTNDDDAGSVADHETNTADTNKPSTNKSDVAANTER